MIFATLFEPVSARIVGPYALLRSSDLKALLTRLQNAEVGFDYAVRHEIKRLQQSRDSHMLNAERLREELTSVRALLSQARETTPDKRNGE